MHFVYHPHHSPIIVSTEDYPTYLESGWYDSPAKFPSIAIKDEKIAAVNSSEPFKLEKKRGRPPKNKIDSPVPFDAA